MTASEGRDTALLERVLVLVKGTRDGELTRRLLARDDVRSLLCADVQDLCARVEEGAGAALLAEETLSGAAVACVRAVLDRQPVWSDLPIIVFSSTEEPRARLLIETVHQLGNVTFLDRPVQVRSMLASIHAAIRSRRRQYETRRAIESRDDFLAMLGHELRNPLGAIRLASEILQTAQGLRAKELDVIERQSRHLSRIVDDLLDVARITHGKIVLRREPLNLADAVRNAYELFVPMARGRLSAFDLVIEDDALWIDGDRQRLEQVFANLLTNAVKYTPRGGSVSIRVRGEGGRAVVLVQDSGIGLAPDMRERVFDVFTQAERSLDRAEGGLGLGLPLVRGIVELHEGAVRAESEGLGKGSAFILSFPRLRDFADTAPPATTVVGADVKEAPHAPKRVVVVEDNADIRELLVELLESQGHEVTCAVDGPEGLAAILAISPDVALVDMGLPGFDGLEVARRVRAAGSNVRLVAVTGYGQLEDKARAARAGFDEHLTKPVERAALARALQCTALSEAATPAARVRADRTS